MADLDPGSADRATGSGGATGGESTRAVGEVAAMTMRSLSEHGDDDLRETHGLCRGLQRLPLICATGLNSSLNSRWQPFPVPMAPG